MKKRLRHKSYLLHWYFMTLGWVLYPVYMLTSWKFILSWVGYYAYDPEPRWKPWNKKERK